MYSTETSKPISEDKLNGGPWNQEECLKYLIFLDQNKIVMASRQKKKRFRVFDQMSDFVETRSSLQCRSHHQKAIEKYKQVKEIISHQKQLINSKEYRLRLKEFRQKAKVKENYENFVKPKILKESSQEINEAKEVKEDLFPLRGFSIVPNFFNFMSTYQFPIIPITSEQMVNNYFYYPFFGQN